MRTTAAATGFRKNVDMWMGCGRPDHVIHSHCPRMWTTRRLSTVARPHLRPCFFFHERQNHHIDRSSAAGIDGSANHARTSPAEGRTIQGRCQYDWLDDGPHRRHPTRKVRPSRVDVRTATQHGPLSPAYRLQTGRICLQHGAHAPRTRPTRRTYLSRMPAALQAEPPSKRSLEGGSARNERRFYAKPPSEAPLAGGLAKSRVQSRDQGATGTKAGTKPGPSPQTSMPPLCPAAGTQCPCSRYFSSVAALSGRHHSSCARYQSIVSSNPSAKSVRRGRQPSSRRIFPASIA